MFTKGTGIPDERRRSQGYDSRAFIQGKSEGDLAQSSMDDMVQVPRIIFRLITMPVWLPYKGWKIIKRRRQMAEFAKMRARNLIMGDRAVREITLDWVKNHPDEYVLGEYDPRIPKLQQTFKKILFRRK